MGAGIMVLKDILGETVLNYIKITNTRPYFGNTCRKISEWLMNKRVFVTDILDAIIFGLDNLQEYRFQLDFKGMTMKF